MENIKLKDVLHLYLGADYWTPNSEGNLNAATLANVYDMLERGVEVQLHLKKPLDMSSKEMVERNFTSMQHLKNWLEYNNGKWPIEDLLWFTKNRFDLFGLIESGQAVDIAKVRD